MNADRQEFQPPVTEDEVRELAHLHATEGFADEDQAFLTWLEEAPEDHLRIFREEVNAVGTLSLAVLTAEEAPPLQLDEITRPQGKSFPPGFQYLASGQGAWRDLPVKGARVKELSDNRADGFTVMLLEMDPGARFPGHHHHGSEQVYLLDGDLSSDGEELSPGDFLRAAADTHHGGLSSRGGCHALIITAQQNYPRRAIRLYDWLSRKWKGARSKLPV